MCIYIYGLRFRVNIMIDYNMRSIRKCSEFERSPTTCVKSKRFMRQKKTENEREREKSYGTHSGTFAFCEW